MAEDLSARQLPGDDAALEDSVKVTPPVDPEGVEPEAEAPPGGTALCLSGGGYRAMLFHLGTLWRLNELDRKRLFGAATLQDLPDRPFFLLNATNMQPGVLWRFTKAFTWDYRVGKIKNPPLFGSM